MLFLGQQAGQPGQYLELTENDDWSAEGQHNTNLENNQANKQTGERVLKKQYTKNLPFKAG